MIGGHILVGARFPSQVDQNHGVERSSPGGLSISTTLPLGAIKPSRVPLPPSLVPISMNSKRLWATAATIFVLSALGPHSSGVWAQNDTAVCGQGWDWVRLVQIFSLNKNILEFDERSSVDFIPCRTGTRLGKMLAVLLPYWTPHVVVSVSVHGVIAATGSPDLWFFSHLDDPTDKQLPELRPSSERSPRRPQLPV